MIVEALAAALICLDPGHGTPPAVGRQREPIGPGSTRATRSRTAAAPRARPRSSLANRPADADAAPSAGIPSGDDAHGPDLPLRKRRERRPGRVLQPPRSRFDAADPRRRLHRLVSSRSLHPLPSPASRLDRRRLRPELAGGPVDPARRSSAPQAPATSGSSGATDLTGFNWANVPVVLVETGFMSNPAEGRLLRSARVPAARRPGPDRRRRRLYFLTIRKLLFPSRRP